MPPAPGFIPFGRFHACGQGSFHFCLEVDVDGKSYCAARLDTNRAVNGAYAPGSTFKPMTAAAALEAGIIDTKTKINATGSWLYPGDPNSHANCWLYNSSGGRHAAGSTESSA